VGLASHEKSVGAEAVARSMLPFVVLWLVTAPIAGVLEANASRWLLLRAWLAAGVTALAARALIFDRELLTAFFAIGLIGNGLFLVTWRTVYDRLVARGAGAEAGR